MLDEYELDKNKYPIPVPGISSIRIQTKHTKDIGNCITERYGRCNIPQYMIQVKLQAQRPTSYVADFRSACEAQC